MRYALRRQEIIRKKLGGKNLDRMLRSLNTYFDNGFDPSDEKEIEGEDFKVLAINDTGHSCGLILFYVIKTAYNVKRLAFKEFVN